METRKKLPRRVLDSSWNVMAHGYAREGKWRGNGRMEWVASTLHTTSEHGVSSITTADAHTSASSSRLNWRPRRFKWTRPFRRKTKSGFCACAITFQTQSTEVVGLKLVMWPKYGRRWTEFLLWKSARQWNKHRTLGCRQTKQNSRDERLWSLTYHIRNICNYRGQPWRRPTTTPSQTRSVDSALSD